MGITEAGERKVRVDIHDILAFPSTENAERTMSRGICMITLTIARK